MSETAPALVRLGLPLVGGALPAAARELGAAVLVSANALARYRGEGKARTFAGFRLEASDLDGMDVALDSAGFVAHALYRGFPWKVADYIALAGSRPWAWWAQMDACCEAEIAANRGTVRLRQAETIRLLAVCRKMAAEAGISAPMPVLQGRTPADYVWHAGQIDLTGETLIGVGSMCRRPVHGPEGLLAVVDALDHVLPAGVRLHLFGVKSEGLAILASHPRVASIDSMAWDVAARREARTGRTMAVRANVMRQWYGRQVAAASKGDGVQGGLFGAGAPEGVEVAFAEWGDLLAGDECSLGEAAYFSAEEDFERECAAVRAATAARFEAADELRAAAIVGAFL